MRIATYNINNVNRRLHNLLAWMAERKPDIVCLQELKAAQRDFPADDFGKAGYRAVWVGQKTWNGVAILARSQPVLTRSSLPGDPDDKQARYVEAAVDGVLIGCLYAPNGNPQPGPKFGYKLSWHERLRVHATALRRSGAPVVLAGDYNIAPTELDIYPSKSYADNALVQPESREAFKRLIGRSWTDALRARYGKERVYTFWDYKRQRWCRDAGLRLDHLLLTPDLAGRLIDAGVDKHVRGLEGASDHAPVWIQLR